MHGTAAYAMGLSNVLREAMACKNLIAARAYGLSGLHDDGEGGE